MQHYTCEKNVYGHSFFSNPTRSRRDIRENSMRAPTFPSWIRIDISVPDQGENWLRHMLKTQEEHRYKFHCSQFATRQAIWLRDDSMLKSSSSDQFWSFYSEILTPYSNRTCKDIGRLPSLFCFVFSLALIVFVFFGSVDRSYLSINRKEKRKERQAVSVSIRAWTTPRQISSSNS